MNVLSATSKGLVDAANVIRRFHGQELTLVDALGLHIMSERATTACWSTDFHLSLTGATLVIHEQ